MGQVAPKRKKINITVNKLSNIILIILYINYILLYYYQIIILLLYYYHFDGPHLMVVITPHLSHGGRFIESFSLFE